MLIDPLDLEDTIQVSIAPPCAPGRDIPGIAFFGRLFDWFAECRQRRRERIALAMLSDHMLRDIGISRAEVDAEFRKPSWRR
jgi:uncharacterized protein YjiS (DUF1127 family)